MIYIPRNNIIDWPVQSLDLQSCSNKLTCVTYESVTRILICRTELVYTDSLLKLYWLINGIWLIPQYNCAD